jgi:hypothetical protein
MVDVEWWMLNGGFLMLEREIAGALRRVDL